MIEPEFVDEERIPLLERDENIEEDRGYEDTQQETSFNEPQTELDTSTLWNDVLTLKYLMKIEVDLECQAATSKSRSLQVNMPISQNPTANSSQKVPCATA